MNHAIWIGAIVSLTTFGTSVLADTTAPTPSTPASTSVPAPSAPVSAPPLTSAPATSVAPKAAPATTTTPATAAPPKPATQKPATTSSSTSTPAPTTPKTPAPTTPKTPVAPTPTPAPAFKPNVVGGSAFGLAALVGLHSPNISDDQKVALVQIYTGEPLKKYEEDPFTMRAELVECGENLDSMTTYHCEITFGKDTIAFDSPRRVHELYSAMVDAGAHINQSGGQTLVKMTALICHVRISKLPDSPDQAAGCSFGQN